MAKFEGKIHGEMNQRAKIDFALALFFADILRARAKLEGKKRARAKH